MKYKLSIILFITIIILLLFVWWRWIYLVPKNLDLVVVKNQTPVIVHPLDSLLQEYLVYLKNSPKLLAQFKRPVSTITLNGILVDACEVTQGNFRRFASWQALQTTPRKKHPKQPKNWHYKSQTQNHSILGQLEVGVGGVSFFDAWAYCASAGGRLPTSSEFEAISAGSSNTIYPWGNTFNNSPWQYQDSALNIAANCGAYPETDSEDGVHDLGNNLLEWTTLNNKAILMGGNAYSRPYKLNSLNIIRRQAAFDFRSQYSGFRCVYDSKNSDIVSFTTPWASTNSVVFIPVATRVLGYPRAKIPALLNNLTDEQLGTINHLPLNNKKLSLKVMRYETTNALYARFLDDPLVYLGFYNNPKQPNNISHTPINWQQQKQKPQHPVGNVTWWSAWAFANWLGGSLPSARQWEALAGANLTRFPYGNEYQASITINRNPEKIITQPLTVNASKDDSKNNIRGLSGNVAEWTNTTVLRDNTFAIIIKGGSYIMPKESAQISQTSEALPSYSNYDLGFRVVFNIE